MTSYGILKPETYLGRSASDPVSRIEYGKRTAPENGRLSPKPRLMQLRFHVLDIIASLMRMNLQPTSQLRRHLVATP